MVTYWTLPDSQLTVNMVTKFYRHITGVSPEAESMGRSLVRDEALKRIDEDGSIP